MLLKRSRSQTTSGFGFLKPAKKRGLCHGSRWFMISHVLDAAIYQQRLLIHQRLRLKRGGGYQQRVCGGVGAYHQVLVAMGVFLTNADSEEGVGSMEGARGQLPPMVGGGGGG